MLGVVLNGLLVALTLGGVLAGPGLPKVVVEVVRMLSIWDWCTVVRRLLSAQLESLMMLCRRRLLSPRFKIDGGDATIGDAAGDCCCLE